MSSTLTLHVHAHSLCSGAVLKILCPHISSISLASTLPRRHQDNGAATEAQRTLQKELEHQRNYPNPGYGEAMPTSYQPPQNYRGPPPGQGPYNGYGGEPPPYGGQQVNPPAHSHKCRQVNLFGCLYGKDEQAILMQVVCTEACLL